MDDGEEKVEEEEEEEGEGEGSRRARRDAFSLSRAEMVPSETSAEVSESRLRDDVSSLVGGKADNDDGTDEEEEGEAGSFGRESEKQKSVAVVEVVLGSAMKLLRFLAGQLDGREEVVGDTTAAVDCGGRW